MSADRPARTPVHLLTGFLGSGKTTLLRALLSDARLSDTAVLINEFGEVGLDHHLLERIDETTVLLQSGCLCCTIRGELATAIRDLESRRARGTIPPFRRLVVESTGLADPFPVLSTLRADPVLSQHFEAGSVIATVDAVNVSDQIARHAETIRQIAAADHLVLTKTDIADTRSTARLADRLAALNPAASLARAPVDEIDPVDLITGDPAALPRAAHGRDDGHRVHNDNHDGGHGDPNRHGGSIRTFALTIGEPIDWTAFGIWLTMLLNRHGASVLRVKGILNLVGEERPVAVHGVQHLVHPPVHMTSWPDADRRSRLVVIVDGLDPDLVRRSFRVFNGLGASHGTDISACAGAATPAPAVGGTG